MSYDNQFPSNQRKGPPPASPLKAQAPSAQPPIARVKQKALDAGVIGDGFRKIGTDIVQQQLPSFFHRLLHSVVDAIMPGNVQTPFVGRSNYFGFTQNPFGTSRMSQMPTYGQRVALGAVQPPAPDVLAQRKSFGSFLLSNKAEALDIFAGLMNDAAETGYLTVSQVYDRLRIPVSYMGVSYYWTVNDFAAADILETPSGECEVKMPKAKLIT